MLQLSWRIIKKKSQQYWMKIKFSPQKVLSMFDWWQKVNITQMFVLVIQLLILSFHKLYYQKNKWIHISINQAHKTWKTKIIRKVSLLIRNNMCISEKLFVSTVKMVNAFIEQQKKISGHLGHINKYRNHFKYQHSCHNRIYNIQNRWHENIR